jgi:hypothetical protein
MGKSGVRGLYPFVRRTIAGSTNNSHPVASPFDPALRFASTFPHECNDNRVRSATGDNRLNYRGLTGTRRPKNAKASTATDSEQAIDDTYTGRKRIGDGDAFVRTRRR